MIDGQKEPFEYASEELAEIVLRSASKLIHSWVLVTISADGIPCVMSTIEGFTVQDIFTRLAQLDPVLDAPIKQQTNQ